MGLCPAFLSHWASLPEVVVLPEPCSPAMRMTDGGWEDFWKRAVSRPRTLTSSSWTILTICSVGERAVATWLPRAQVRMCSMSSVTTSRLTSDSRRARRISRRASEMFSSVMEPWPRRFLKDRWSLSLRFSNMLVQVYRERRHVAEGSVDLNKGTAFGKGDREVYQVCVGIGKGLVSGGITSQCLEG